MKLRKTLIVAAIVGIFALVGTGILSCNLAPSTGKRLTLEFPSARGFQDPGNLYRLSGTGPNGATFGPQTYSIQTTSAELDGLVFGSWSFVFEETDASGTSVFFSITFEVEIKAGITDATVYVTMAAALPPAFATWNFGDDIDDFGLSNVEADINQAPDRYGIAAGATRYGGDGYLTKSYNVADIPSTGGFAISLWTKGPPAPEDRFLLSNIGEGSKGLQLHFSNLSNSPRLSFDVDGQQIGGYIPCGDLNKDWNNIVISIDFDKAGPNTSVFFNGNAQAFSGNVSADKIQPLSGTWQIGGRSSFPSQNYRGTIDGIQFFHQTLSQGNVDALYSQLGPQQQPYAPVNALPPAANLIAEWLFNDSYTDGSYEDTSNQDAHQTDTTPTTSIARIADRFGAPNSAIEFDTASRAMTTADPPPGALSGALPESFTVSWWMKKAGQDGNIMWRFGKWVISNESEGAEIYIRNHETTAYNVNISNPELDSVWFQVTITYVSESDTLIFYINGVEEYAWGGVPFELQTTSPVVLGGGSGAAVGLNLDDIRIYNKALTSDEVFARYALP